MQPAQDVAVRPMTGDDVQDAAEVGRVALDELAAQPRPADAERLAWVQGRAAHVLRHDPDGSWVAEHDGTVVGVALATVRGDLWFLSLLAVRRDLQGTGVGRRLLDAALTTSVGCTRAALLASGHPGALRRYLSAGFALEPALEARGRLRAAGSTAVGVRETDVDRSRDLLEAVDAQVRGVTRGPDWELLRATPGRRVLVVDEEDARQGYALLRDESVDVVAAAEVDVARRLLTSALATLASRDGDVERVHSLTARQGWAHEVAVDAGLTLRPGSTVCTRGAATSAATPYLAHGAVG